MSAPVTGMTVIDLGCETRDAETLADLPPLFREVFSQVGVSTGGRTRVWVEGTAQMALSAVWGITTHLDGHSHPENHGPSERYGALGLVELTA